MLGCMVESQLGVVPAAAIASLADWADLDGHLLLADQPFTGLRLPARPCAPRRRAGPGVRPREHGSRSSPRAVRQAQRQDRPRGDPLRDARGGRGDRFELRGPDAAEVEPFCVKPAPIVASLDEAIECGLETLLIGVAPPGGKLDPAWRSVLLRR